ncbi:hypothetical protein NDU88_005186 [Pleurodeles waltl]|uniref:Uncharacterized protein n=1 Tax=Pleurodeles waltl TaxID=8319 RepID=A0AAV7T9P8_PLEWA|nr:hypothetical protein NDU88_005186 [Pleurodeles waltl]
MSASCAVRGENRDPILGLRPRRAITTVRGRRKGPPRAPRPLTRAAACPAARPGDSVASHAVRPEGAAAARGATVSNARREGPDTPQPCPRRAPCAARTVTQFWASGLAAPLQQRTGGEKGRRGRHARPGDAAASPVVRPEAAAAARGGTDYCT